MAHLLLNWDDQVPADWQAGVVTVGNFDGFHLGHRALVEEAVRQARAVHGPAIAISFEPHPLKILRPAQFQPVLTSAEDRVALIQNAGADHVLLLRATPSLLNLSAQDFFSRVLCHHLKPKALVEGQNFGFGHKREGNIATLEVMSREAGIRLTVVPPVLFEERPISSSRVRHALVAGHVREAALQLGRPYRLRGVVGTGENRGKKLGFPTANLKQELSLIPGDGVYAVGVTCKGARWMGAANVGPNPTFGEAARKVEVHLLDFDGDLVGEALAMDFFERLRDTRAFPSVDALVEQLKRDIDAARQACTMHWR